MNKRSIFARTMGYFFRYKWKFITLFICYFAAAGLNLVWPYLNGAILYDKVLAKDNGFLARFGMAGEYVLALLLLVGVMVLSKLVQQGVALLQGTLMAQVVAATIRDMKQDVFSSMGNLSINFFTSKQTGSLMTRVLSDADRVTDFFLDGFPYIFVHGFTILASFTVMFRLNWQMALVACILLPLLVIMSVKLKPKLWSLFGRRHRAERAVNSRVNDNLTGARVVKAFGQQEQENLRFESPNERLRDAEVRIVKYNNRFTILYNLVQEISNIWVWILGVVLLLNTGSVELGVLITFVGYVGQLNGPMNFFSRVFHMWSNSINAAQRMFEIMDAVPEIQEIDHPVRMTEPRGEITLEHVTFGYDINNPVLKDISLHVKEGEMLGIVGRSGAGKSTLVNLISRLYDVNEGRILLDGVNVKDIAFRDLRRNVAMVSQDTYIFMGTIPKFGVTMNYVSWFICLYFIAAYIRLYPKKVFEEAKLWGVCTAVLAILCILSVLCCVWIGARIDKQIAFYFVTDSNTFLAVCIGVSSFLFFKNLKIKQSRVINTFAASTFGVLLIHANSDTMRKWLWQTLLNVNGAFSLSTPLLVLHATLSVLGVFIVCVIIDQIRIRTVERFVLDKAEKGVNRLLSR